MAESNQQLERNIIRRFVFAAVTSIAILSLAAGGGYSLWLGQVMDHRNASAQSYLAALWQSTFQFHADQLTQRAIFFTRSTDTADAFLARDKVRLETLHRPTYNRLSALNVLTDMDLVDTQGDVLFGAHAADAVGAHVHARFAQGLPQMAIRARKVVVGLDLDEFGVPRIAAAVPLFHDRGVLIGVVYLAQAVESALIPIARSTGAVLAVVVDGVRLGASSDVIAASGLMATLPENYVSEPRVTAERAGRMWQRVVATLGVSATGERLELISFTDETRAVWRERAAALRFGAVILVGLILALYIIYRTVVRESEQLRGALAQQVAARTRDLVRARDQACAAERAMATFLANMSHELRTPLHGILSFAKLGVAKHATVGAAKLSEFFVEIRDSGNQLLGLVNNLLDLSKLRAGKMDYDYQSTDLRRLARDVTRELQLLAADKHITVELTGGEQPLMVTIDAARIGQVLRNLLFNALKFSSADGVVTVGVALAAAGEAMVSVADQGVGIPESELRSIFDPFTQSSRTRSRAGGTGLGLPICREIIEEGHRGRIAATSLGHGGACFTFVIPVARAPGAAESRAA